MATNLLKITIHVQVLHRRDKRDRDRLEIEDRNRFKALVPDIKELDLKTTKFRLLFYRFIFYRFIVILHFFSYV